eukprot:GFUD01115642.1.p1 GENE.GFUD01115642.1~~GFUD01115642.1.p1  ORF type:complete len:190 (+),score=61.29 GFUD01115642.1:53-622(+)
MMRVTGTVICSLWLVLCVEGSTRVRREECAKVTEDFTKCTHKAYEEYKAVHGAGDDEKPDWMARKSCNYVTAAVEDCGNKLVGECNTEEQVTAMKDRQLKGNLVQLQTSLDEWDSDKCPAVKAHIERMKAAEAKDAMDGNDQTGATKDDSEPEADPPAENKEEENNSANALTLSSFFLILVSLSISIIT